MSIWKNTEVRRTALWLLLATAVCSVAAALLYPICGLLTLGLGAVCGAIWYGSTRRRYRELERMSRDIDRILHGQEQQVLPQQEEGELAILRSEIGKMTVRLRENAQRQQEERVRLADAMADISHQLRTPLTAMRLTLSLLEQEELTPQQREQAQVILQQSEKLSFLIETLVKLSRLETDVLVVTPKLQPLSPLLERAVSQVKAAAGQKGIALQLHLQQQAEMKALYDLRWTAEALGNLLDNAVKYTPPGGCIQVSATQYELFCRIDVHDNGIGIAEEEQAQIFGRFYRGRQVREQEGLGIGLYIAREIVQKQGGYLKLSSRPGQGSTFSLYLPRG